MYVQSLGGAKLAGKPFITFLVEYASKAIKRPENVEKELEEGNPNYKEILIYRQGYNKGVDDLLDFLTKE